MFSCDALAVELQNYSAEPWLQGSIESRPIAVKSLPTTKMEIAIVALMSLKNLYPTFLPPLFITSLHISHVPSTAEHILLSKAQCIFTWGSFTYSCIAFYFFCISGLPPTLPPFYQRQTFILGPSSNTQEVFANLFQLKLVNISHNISSICQFAYSLSKYF